MQEEQYPQNLILDMYADTGKTNQLIKQIDIPSLLETLNYLTDSEHIGILKRYQEGTTFRKVGDAIGENTISARQTVARGLKRLRRFGEHNYFHLNPTTGQAYTRDEIEPYIGELKLNSAAETALIRAGYETIEQVRPLSEDELKAIPNFGERHYENYAEKIAAYEKQNELIPYPKVTYPENLLNAIYGERKEKRPGDKFTNLEEIEQALQMLSNQERLFILKKYKDGFSMQRIGDEVGLSINRVSQAIHRGLLKLKEKSRTKYYEPAGSPQTPKPRPRIKAVLQDVYPYNLIAKIMGTDDSYLRTAYLEGFHQEIKRLPETFRTFVRLRYEFGLTLAACGKRMNKSEYELELIERRTHQKLRDKKQDGLLTAVSKSQVVEMQHQQSRLMNENKELKTLLQQVATGELKPEDVPLPTPETEAKPLHANESIPIEKLELSVRAYNALSINRWNTLHHITQHTREEFMALRRVGVTVEREIDQLLAEHGVSFKDETPKN